MKLLISVVFLCLTLSSYASESLNPQEWASREYELVQEKLLEFETSEYSMNLKTLQIRLRATYGVEIPFLAKAKVRPEIEFYFEK